jgi:thymidylate synthase ThyX
MSYDCKILADSVNPVGHRITTFEVTFPRFILAEVNTHRMLSRNSASSRAIPTEKQIERVLKDPFVPHFNKRVTGMGVGEPLSGAEQIEAVRHWYDALNAAVKAARGLIHVDKSRANRLLEPFMWHTAIITATEWENFYHLRDHEAAQPEFRKIASIMRAARAFSTPKMLDWGQWHLPLWYPEDANQTWGSIHDRFPAEVSAGRCARVSYDRQHDTDTVNDAAGRWIQLSGMGHWSPGEHPARSITKEEWDDVQARQEEEVETYELRDEVLPDSLYDSFEFIGNFRGFVQLRKHYPGEAVFQG